MKNCKNVLAGTALIGLLGVFNAVCLVGGAHADESVGEKAQATGNDAGRALKKGAHRVEESVCMQSDSKCLEEKAKHRAEEGKDYTKDKMSELKNDIDTKK